MYAGSSAPKENTEEMILQRYDIFKKTMVINNFKDSLLISNSIYYKNIEKILSTDQFNSIDVQYEIIVTAKRLCLNPEWLTFVIYKESRGITTATNPISGAAGLIGYLPSTAECLGYDISTIKKMTFKEQLPIVDLYFRNSGKLHEIESYEDSYLCVFYPSAIGKSNIYRLGIKPSKKTLEAYLKKGKKMPFKQAVYYGNSSMDVNKNGIITVKEFKTYANII